MANYVHRRMEALAFALRNGLSLKQGLRELEEMHLQPRLHAHSQTSYTEIRNGRMITIQTNAQTVHLHYKDEEWGGFQSGYKIESKVELIALLEKDSVDVSHTVEI